jgi:parallel beta-helix repeat protein
MHLFSIGGFARRVAVSAVAAVLLVGSVAAVASAAVCTGTGYEEDGHELTAVLVNPAAPVTGAVEAIGCDIGVYYDSTHSGSVTGATITGARYYGVLVNGGTVDVTNSQIRFIGDGGNSGAQHGDAIAYRNGATGTISGNTVRDYQKTGILVTTGSSAQVLNNTVTGAGMIDYIAQNGIQISYGATAKVVGNNVSGNWYTPKSYVACGLLIYRAGGVGASKGGIAFIKAENNFHDNEVDICNFGKGGAFRD